MRPVLSILIMAVLGFIIIRPVPAFAENVSSFFVINPYPQNTKEWFCANRSTQNWTVTSTGLRVQIDPSEHQDVTKKTMKVSRGQLVAEDKGEGGGGLSYVVDGKSTILINTNTSYLFVLPRQHFVAFGGQSHQAIDEGFVAIVDCSSASECEVTNKIALPANPSAITMKSPGEFIFVTHLGVSSFSLALKTVNTLYAGNYRGLFPNSVVETTNGEIYVGMRYAISHLVPSQGGYTETWLVHKRCVDVNNDESVYEEQPHE
jgi:hypothetical protein